MAAPLCVTVLAAGKGTRMRNALPKVLHPLAGRTLIEHVLANAQELRPAQTVVVLAAEMSEVAAVRREIAARTRDRDPGAAARHRPRGQGGAGGLAGQRHGAGAVRRHAPATRGDPGAAGSGTRGRGCSRGGAGHAARPIPPAMADCRSAGERLVAVIEDRDAEPDLKRAAACNSGVMAFDAARLPASARGLGAAWRQGRILSHRHGGAGGGARLDLRRGRGAGRRGTRA